MLRSLKKNGWFSPQTGVSPRALMRAGGEPWVSVGQPMPVDPGTGQVSAGRLRLPDQIASDVKLIWNTYLDEGWTRVEDINWDKMNLTMGDRDGLNYTRPRLVGIRSFYATPIIVLT